jgi:hypothetical protein
MKARFGSAMVLVVATVISAATGCAVTCIEDAGGQTCTAKSLKRFDGPVPPNQMLDRAPGAPVTIDVVYGNVLVQRSVSGKVEVQFAPYDYVGYDDKAGADRELAQNLRTSAVAAGGITVSVQRQGGSTGLGADTIVRIPDDFDGVLTIMNRGDGPLNDFDVRVDHVGRASALNVTNQSILGDCTIQGAPSVKSTTVRCAERISVLDVSDAVTIENAEEMSDGVAVTLRLAGVAPTSPGGRIATNSGSIAVTLPGAGGYVVNAKSPVKGQVREGTLPRGCAVRGAPNEKTITCGQGPAYSMVAGARPEHPTPRDNDVLLSYR